MIDFRDVAGCLFENCAFPVRHSLCGFVYYLHDRRDAIGTAVGIFVLYHQRITEFQRTFTLIDEAIIENIYVISDLQSW